MTHFKLFDHIVQVASDSTPGKFYTVNLSAKTCTCPQHAKLKKVCKHLKQLGITDKATMPFAVSNDSKEQMLKYDQLMLTRLSPNHILRDFMFSTQSEILGLPNRPSDDVQQVIQSGKSLCEKIMEPLRDQFGPLSITFGYQSRELIEAGAPKMSPKSSSPHQWDRGTFGDEIYARVDVLIYKLETGQVTKAQVGRWMMYNLDVDLLMMWQKSNVLCITISPKPRRVWLEWVPNGQGENGSNKNEYMGAKFWNEFDASALSPADTPKFYPSATNGSMSWNQYK